jgi:hypothetical protein
MKLQGITSQKNIILTNMKCIPQVGNAFDTNFKRIRIIAGLMFLTKSVSHLCYQLVEYIMTRSIHISTGVRNKETHSLTHVSLERGKGEPDVNDVPILSLYPPHNII